MGGGIGAGMGRVWEGYRGVYRAAYRNRYGVPIGVSIGEGDIGGV